MYVYDTEIQKNLLKTKDLDLKKTVEFCRIAEITKTQTQTLQEKSTVLEVRAKKFGKKLDMPSKFQGFQNKNFSKDFNCNSNKNVISSGNFNKKNVVSYNGNFNRSTNITNNNKCYRCNYVHFNRPCPAMGKKCSKCGGVNHFASVCRNKKIKEVIYEQSSDDEISNLFIDSLCVATVNKNKTSAWIESLKVEGEIIKFKLDTGSEVNIIPLKIFKTIRKELSLIPTDFKLETYGGFKIKPMGSVNLKVEFKSAKKLLNFIVADVSSNPILGLSSSVELGLLKRVDYTGIINKKEKIINEYKENFNGIGKFPIKAHIPLNEKILPIIKPSRRIPFSIRDGVKKKLDEMEKVGIIDKIDQPKGWVSNLVIVEKPNKSLRLCLDPRDLNLNIRKEPCLIPTLDDLRYALKDMKYFSVLDLKEGFWQVELDEFSSNNCGFSTLWYESVDFI